MSALSIHSPVSYECMNMRNCIDQSYAKKMKKQFPQHDWTAKDRAFFQDSPICLKGIGVKLTCKMTRRDINTVGELFRANLAMGPQDPIFTLKETRVLSALKLAMENCIVDP